MKKSQILVLKKQLIWRYLFCFVLIISLEFVLFLISNYGTISSDWIIPVLYVLAIIGGIALIHFYTKSIRSDLKNGIVNIHKKEIDKRTEHEVIENWIYKKKNNEPYIKYFFHSSGVSYRVTKELYSSRKVGDSFELPYAPASKIEFQVED